MTVTAPRARGGFTLVEVMVAVVILGFAAAGFAGLLIKSAQTAQDAGAIGYRTAVLNAEVSRIAAKPAGTLSAGTTTTTVTTQPFPYTMTTVIATTGNTQTVTITVTPSGYRAIGAVTRTIQRDAAVTSNPFGS